MSTPRLLALALAGAAGLTLVAPAAAFAAPHARKAPAHAAPHARKAPAHAPHHATKDRLAGPLGAAMHVIAADTKGVQRLAAQEQANPLLSATDKAALATFDTAALGALSADAAGVPAATTVAQLNGIKQAAALTTQSVRFVGTVVSAATQQGVDAAQITAAAATLTSQEALLPTGTDTAALNASLTDLALQVNNAQAALAAAETGAYAVPAAPSRAALTAARQAAGASLDTAETALAAAATDLTAASTALAALSPVPAT